MTMIRFPGRYLLTGLLALGFALPLTADDAPEPADDFEDGTLSRRSWERSFNAGKAKLEEKDGKLHYLVSEGTEKDFQYALWKGDRFRADQDWEVYVTAFNDGLPISSQELVSIGIEAYNARKLGNRVSVSLSVSRLEGIYARVAFSQVTINGVGGDSDYSSEMPEMAQVRLSYDAESGVLTASGRDPEEDEGWIDVASFGLRGDGGTTADVDFGLGRRGQFLVYVYGYSENMTLEEGDTYVEEIFVNP